MKKLIHNIIITSFVFLVFLAPSGIYSNEIKDSKEIKINLINISEEDYIEFYQPFVNNGSYTFNRHYLSSKEIFNPEKNTINFFKNEKEINGKSYSLLSANFIDIKGTPFLIEWTISAGFSEDFRKTSAVKFTTDLVMEAQNDDVIYAVSKKITDSESIINLSPVYPDTDFISSINGYEFDYRIKRSSAYYAVRTTTEILLGCGVGVGNYYMNKYENKVDWQYEYTWDDAQRKVKDGWYWDPNNFNTNTLYHLYSGMTYYQIARSNYYSIAESLAWTFAGSFFWEFFGEWREQVSLNDMIFTPMLGAITGEALIQTRDYIEKSMEPGILREFICLTIDPFGWLNKMIDSTNTGEMRVRLIFMNPLQTAAQEKLENEILHRN